MPVDNLFGFTMSVSKMLFPKLKQEIKRLRESNVTRQTIAGSQLSRIILDELNLTISVGLEGGPANAFIQMPLLNEDHPFLKRYRTGVASGDAIALITRAKGLIEGGFDRVGKAYGVFAEMHVNMGIGDGLFHSKFTDGEIAAIMCHEIGHYRTALEGLKWGFTTSHLMRTTIDAFLGTKNREERTKLVLTLEGATGNIINGKEKVIDSNDETLVTTVIVGAAIDIKSDVNTNAYDVSMCEQAADQFAVACGADADLVNALHKISWYFTASRIPRPLYYLFEIYNMCQNVILLTIPVGAIFLATRLILSGNPLATTYNKTEERLSRIRKAAVIESKAEWLTKDQRRSIAERIKDMDNIIAMHKDRPSFYELFFSLIMPGGRSNKRNADFVRLYEDLLANDLHVGVNKIKSLG